MNIDDIAVDNPELKIVMCHLGNPWIEIAKKNYTRIEMYTQIFLV